MENQKILGNVCYLRTGGETNQVQYWNEIVAYICALELVAKTFGASFDDLNKITEVLRDER